jgi:hypothetical protein
MSVQQTDETTTDASPAAEPAADLDREDLAAQLDLLAEENQRLREEYARVRTSQYRRTALGLGALGALAVGAGALFPGTRTVLVVLGAIGLFGGLLTYYLTPEQFISASVGERVYASLADSLAEIGSDLGLSSHRVYVPTDDTGARLFVPQHDAFELPAADALETAFVAVEDSQSRGLATTPTGEHLFAEFETARTGPLADELGPLASQLTDALVEQFELADSIRIETDADRWQVTFGVTGEPYGPLDRFDHPVASFLAVGLAHGLDTPVTLNVTAGESRSDYLVQVQRYEPAPSTDT